MLLSLFVWLNQSLLCRRDMRQQLHWISGAGAAWQGDEPYEIGFPRCNNFLSGDAAVALGVLFLHDVIEAV
ncbi:hypothetical protein CGRA01v4_13344 [Colletotrichum graminicola]|nr:hypothetical protein CGRA01v4_13344 [Colletotrichum graminicola]